MNLVVSTCYVIESRDFGIEPVIYLNRPNTHPTNEILHLCLTVFEAKNLIQLHLTSSIEITVTKETHSQLRLVQC